MATPMGVIAATGQSFEVPFVEIWRVRDGKVASVHGYFDSATVMQQWGVVPPTEG